MTAHTLTTADNLGFSDAATQRAISTAVTFVVGENRTIGTPEHAEAVRQSLFFTRNMSTMFDFGAPDWDAVQVDLRRRWNFDESFDFYAWGTK